MARFNDDTLSKFACANEILGYSSIALSGAITVHGILLFDGAVQMVWLRWLGADAAITSLCVGIATAALLRNLRRRDRMPQDTLYLFALMLLSLGWFCTLVGLAHSMNGADANRERVGTTRPLTVRFTSV
jgi:hypothetical protein